MLNEKFGDGIMSAISFSTNVKKETDEAGNPWVVITLRGKWYRGLHLMLLDLQSADKVHQATIHPLLNPLLLPASNTLCNPPEIDTIFS